MKAPNSQSNSATRQALEGRLPILPDERIYDTFSSVLWTWVILAGNSAVFLIGVVLPQVGNKEGGIAAYVSGNILGYLLVVLSNGFPTVRYGVETVDATKPTFGTRGIIVTFILELVLLLGTSCLLAATATHAIGNVFKVTILSNADPSATCLAIIGLTILFAVWVATCMGPRLFEHVTKYLGPTLIGISIIVLLILFSRFGAVNVFRKEAPSGSVLTTDKLKGFMLAFEWGAAFGLSWWPVIGGITRLVKRQDDVLSPPLLAYVVFALVPLLSAALASVMTNTYDPTWWLVLVCGRLLGTVAVAVVALANIFIMIIQFYLAGVVSQQLRFLTRVRWEMIVAGLMLPGVYFSFWPDWVLSNFTTILTYMGVMFAGVAGVTCVDYFVLRRQQFQIQHIFTHGPHGRYFFWRGFNVVALIVVTFGFWFDLLMYNPVTMSSHGWFRYIGATIPTVLACGTMYYILMRLVAIPLGKGAYLRYRSHASRETGDEGKIIVAL